MSVYLSGRSRMGRHLTAVVISFILTLSSVLISARSVSASEESLTSTGFFLDTVITISIYGTSDSSVMDTCFEIIDGYEKMFSRTIEGSDVWNINHSNGEPTTVSEETAYLIETSLFYSELSEGSFDITILPVAELWDIQNNPGIIPSDDDIADALLHVDYTNVSLDGTTVTLLDKNVEIDLGGIAKGYIADCVADYLESQGITSALLNLGGDVQTIGAKTDGSKWKIGIQQPFGGSSDLAAVVECEGQSIVTSGNYERYFELDGHIYHHIIDPSTGYPADSGLTSVTVMSDSSTIGDVLSTACFVLGLDSGMALLESLDGYEGLFITEDNQICRTSGFPK